MTGVVRIFTNWTTPTFPIPNLSGRAGSRPRKRGWTRLKTKLRSVGWVYPSGAETRRANRHEAVVSIGNAVQTCPAGVGLCPATGTTSGETTISLPLHRQPRNDRRRTQFHSGIRDKASIRSSCPWSHLKSTLHFHYSYRSDAGGLTTRKTRISLSPQKHDYVGGGSHAGHRSA